MSRVTSCSWVSGSVPVDDAAAVAATGTEVATIGDDDPVEEMVNLTPPDDSPRAIASVAILTSSWIWARVNVMVTDDI